MNCTLNFVFIYGTVTSRKGSSSKTSTIGYSVIKEEKMSQDTDKKGAWRLWEQIRREEPRCHEQDGMSRSAARKSSSL